jgi:hypothetical protein
MVEIYFGFEILGNMVLAGFPQSRLMSRVIRDVIFEFERFLFALMSNIATIEKNIVNNINLGMEILINLVNMDFII